MSILIRGMEKPENCFDCAWSCKVDPETLLCRISGEYFDETFSNLIDGRDKNCPLVEVPSPHGRLIDADQLIQCLNNCMIFPQKQKWTGKDVITLLKNRHAIIEAEGEGE